MEAVTGTETTFAEMTEKSVKCALWLKEQAVQPGDIIGICTHNHLESYVPLLAALYVGAISNPWDNELSPSTLLSSQLSQFVSAFFAPSIKSPNEIAFSRIENYVIAKHSHFSAFIFAANPKDRHN